MNKVAVLFHGIVGGSNARNGIGSPIDFVTCSKLIKHCLLHCDHDIFMHSWSVDQKDQLIEIYQPKAHLFEPQEYFNYSFSELELLDQERTHGFRTRSRYASLERAVNLMKAEEQSKGFIYDSILILRYDLVVLNKINLDIDLENFYICYEPHWPNIHAQGMMHDVIFYSGRNIMEQFFSLFEDINQGLCNDILDMSHVVSYRKLMSFLEPNKIQYLCKRFEDMDIYRFVVNPDLNELGKTYGGLETKARMDSLLEKING